MEDIHIKEKMVIHSLNGKLDDAEIIRQLGDNDYEAVYKGVHCHAIYNIFVGRYYLDDKYAVIREKGISEREPCR